MITALSLALEALQKERQRSDRDPSMLTIRAIETIEQTFRDYLRDGNDTQTPPVHKLMLCKDAMREFCDRVERGEVKSKYTYAKFKELLDL